MELRKVWVLLSEPMGIFFCAARSTYLFRDVSKRPNKFLEPNPMLSVYRDTS